MEPIRLKCVIVGILSVRPSKHLYTLKLAFVWDPTKEYFSSSNTEDVLSLEVADSRIPSLRVGDEYYIDLLPIQMMANPYIESAAETECTAKSA